MKTLERKYSKTERIVAKAKFSPVVFLRDLLLAVILGGIVAVVWIFKDKIEGVFTKSAEPAQYLTDDVMRWVLLGVGVFVLVCFILHLLSYLGKELVLTEDKIVYREGVLGVHTAVIPLSAIRIVETKQNPVQRFAGYGSIVIISDAEKPYTIKGVSGVDRLTRRMMRQLAVQKNIQNRPVRICLSAGSAR